MPQKHSTIRDGKRLVWYTEKLWMQSRDLPPFEIDISSIKELDEDCWFGQKKPTLREIARHCKKINTASLKYPIILNVDGSLMDGGHRLCKAILEGRKTIKAVQFPSMPEPDEIQELDPWHGS
ncbi:MAG: chromosome partitioning protein ParB [Gemmatimonadetes bacterium]|nr:chromosome partitioning protein ParB [Gemmatimonadota bacterium]